jgi:ATP-dependent Clp protease ATP-binding subunit ClpA
MYQRFTDRARKVVQLANQEAQLFNHEYIGTEHLLLGLIKEGSGVAAHVLKRLDIDLPEIRLEVEKLVQSGPKAVTKGNLPQTPRAKKVIEYAQEESRALNSSYVGTEHLLLGLIREKEGVAAQILMNLGLTLEQVRAEVLGLLRPSGERHNTPVPTKINLQNYDGRLNFIRLAFEEAGKLKHDRLSAGHFLLAMLQEKDGVFVRTINSLGLTVEIVRNEILRQMKQPPK